MRSFTLLVLIALVGASSARLDRRQRRPAPRPSPPRGPPARGPQGPPTGGAPGFPGGRPGFPGAPGHPSVNVPISSSASSTGTPTSSSAPVDGPAPTAGCDVSAFQPSLPAPLAVPAAALTFVTYGTGVQNYTCSAAGNYTATGAVAVLLDASCRAADPTTFNNIDTAGLPTIGHHYFQGFQVNGATAAKPVFDFRFEGPLSADPNGFVTVKKDQQATAPTNPATDVAWLQLSADTVSNTGTAATTVFRIATHGGQPPASCDPGDTTTLSVPYTAAYLFYA